MIRKKLFVAVMYILACCAITSACSFTAKEETEQSSEKKAKKKSKKKKKKKETEFTTEEEETEETYGNSQEKKELQKELIAALDDFLAADVSEIIIISKGNGTDTTIIADRVKYKEDILHLVSVQSNDSDIVSYILTDSKDAYISRDSGENWEKSEDEMSIHNSARVSSSYVSYISFIYAALDAGLEYSYDSANKIYLIKSDPGKVSNINMAAISSKINNIDRLKEYDAYLNINEKNLKSYADEFGIASKSYEFYVEDNVFYVVESLYDKSGNETENSTVTRVKGKEAASIEEEPAVMLINELKGQGNSQ